MVDFISTRPEAPTEEAVVTEAEDRQVPQSVVDNYGKRWKVVGFWGFTTDKKAINVQLYPEDEDKGGDEPAR